MNSLIVSITSEDSKLLKDFLSSLLLDVSAKYPTTHVRSRFLGHFQNFLHVEITLLGGRRPNVVGFIGLEKQSE